MVHPESAWRFVAGASPARMVDLGWRSVGVLELLALRDIGPERWEPWVRGADVLLVDGGDATYLARQLRASGLAELLSALDDLVWVGVSAGSMVLTLRIGDAFVAWQGSGGDDRTLGLVDFAIFPHLEHPGFDTNTMARAERWAADIGVEAYALDDRSAIAVVDGQIEVISAGTWRHFPAV